MIKLNGARLRRWRERLEQRRVTKRARDIATAEREAAELRAELPVIEKQAEVAKLRRKIETARKRAPPPRGFMTRIGTGLAGLGEREIRGPPMRAPDFGLFGGGGQARPQRDPFADILGTSRPQPVQRRNKKRQYDPMKELLGR